MSIKISVEIRKNVIVEIPVERYDDINVENMPLKESDELIIDAITNKYGIYPDGIRVIKEIKESEG